MAHLQRTIDTLLQLWDGAAAITSDGYTQSDGANGQVDLGGDTIKGTATTARMACAVELVPSVIDVGNNDEAYVITVVASNSVTFASHVILSGIEFCSAGATAKLLPDPGLQATAGTRYLIPFINERAGTVYRYIRLYVDCTGTSTTGITGTAYLSKVGEFPV